MDKVAFREREKDEGMQRTSSNEIHERNRPLVFFFYAKRMIQRSKLYQGLPNDVLSPDFSNFSIACKDTRTFCSASQGDDALYNIVDSESLGFTNMA